VGFIEMILESEYGEKEKGKKDEKERDGWAC